MLVACGRATSSGSKKKSSSESSETSLSESETTSQSESSQTSQSESSEVTTSSSEQPSGDYRTVNFVPGDFGSAMESQGDFEATAQGLTLSAVNSKLHNVYGTEEIELRVYVGGSIKFTAESIKEIVFTTETPASDGVKYGPAALEVTDGTYATNGTTGTWSGLASNVTFEASSFQCRIVSFSVTYK